MKKGIKSTQLYHFSVSLAVYLPQTCRFASANTMRMPLMAMCCCCC